MKAGDTPRSLEQILLDEGDALLEGRFADLPALHDEREAAIAGLSEADARADSRIRILAARNMRLARAAATGLKLGHERLVKITQGASFDTYSPEGERQQIRDQRPRLHRRA